MKYGGLEQVSWQQLEAANYGMSTQGDEDVLEDLGIVRSPESLARHVACAAEVANVLGIDMRTPAEIRRQDTHEYYAEMFFLSGNEPLSDGQRRRNEAGLRLARSELEERRAS